MSWVILRVNSLLLVSTNHHPIVHPFRVSLAGRASSGIAVSEAWKDDRREGDMLKGHVSVNGCFRTWWYPKMDGL